mgnify:CR=1 FL=1
MPDPVRHAGDASTSSARECGARPEGLALGVNPPSRATVGLRSDRGPILLALMVSTGLIAIDATVLATAVPSIVREVGGFSQFPWLFSVYLLAQAVSVSVYAKLAPMRRQMLRNGRSETPASGARKKRPENV